MGLSLREWKWRHEIPVLKNEAVATGLVDPKVALAFCAEVYMLVPYFSL